VSDVDLLVIGAGPAGLSAALNGAAEGLSTRVLEASERTGGQASTSSLIENYPGYPEGADGATIAQDFTDQAERLGADITLDARVDALEAEDGGYVAHTASGGPLTAASVVLAAGVDYRRLDVEGADSDRIRYGATPDVHTLYAREHVAVIGAANSAGQAALNLARLDARVTILARRTLRAGTSAYLAARIEDHPLVYVREHVSVERAHDDGERLALYLTDGHVLYVAAAFAYIGAQPRTGFLIGSCEVDERGFVQADVATLESSLPGVFVAGDVRAGSRKRVAAAVGEGAVAAARAWQYVHQALAK
jgi:thioredoxin reductase (NADPH)